MDEAENVCCALSASISEALHTNPTHACSGPAGDRAIQTAKRSVTRVSD